MDMELTADSFHCPCGIMGQLYKAFTSIWHHRSQSHLPLLLTDLGFQQSLPVGLVTNQLSRLDGLMTNPTKHILKLLVLIPAQCVLARFWAGWRDPIEISSITCLRIPLLRKLLHSSDIRLTIYTSLGGLVYMFRWIGH